MAEYAEVDPDQRDGTALHWGHNLLIHLAAALAFTWIYSLGARSLVSGTAAMLVTTVLVTRLFWYGPGGIRSAFLYGLTAGMLTGLMTWTLNYWLLSAFQGGLLLLIWFYLIAGLIGQYVRRRFSTRIALEYLFVAFVGLLALFFVTN